MLGDLRRPNRIRRAFRSGDNALTPPRNAPCPCGSGMTYGRCCGAMHGGGGPGSGHGPDSAGPFYESASQLTKLRESARRDRTWEVTAVPLPAALNDDPDARPVVLMAATRDVVLAVDVVDRLSGEPEAVAEALLGILRRAMEQGRTRPRRVTSHHPEVARALAALLADSGPEVCSIETRDRTYGPARGLIADMMGGDLWPPMSTPATWGAWDLRDEALRELFSAAAAFYRDRPWRSIPDGAALDVRFPDGAAWGGSVMGNAGEVFGLSLYQDPAELLEVYDYLDPAEAFDRMKGRVVSLMFEAADELPRPMRRELGRKGWEVADPTAYPVLNAINTPGGGVSLADLERLTEALRAIPRWIEGTEPPDGAAEVTRLGGPDAAFFHPTLRPAGPRGSGARPGDFLALPEEHSDSDADQGGPGLGEPDTYGPIPGDPSDALVAAAAHARLLVQDFAAELDRSGLGHETVRSHALNVSALLRFLLEVRGIPVGGISEGDLREFLHDWHPRHFDDGLTVARRMPVSLKRFFRYLEREEDLQLPWAGPILEDRGYIRLRMDSCPGSDPDDPRVSEWRLEVMDELERRLLRPDLGGYDELSVEGGVSRRINLTRQLERSWVVWRDELIEEGVDDPLELVADLVQRQSAWELSVGIETPAASVP